MSLEEPEFVQYMKPMFKQYGADYDKLKEELADPKQTFEVFSHFYYFICKPNQSEDEVRDELRFIGLTSLMEALMSEILITSVGYREKVREYFRRFYANELGELGNSGVWYWPRNSSEPILLKKAEDVADFLYDMRSEFVHEARMHGLKPASTNRALTKVKDKHYEIVVSIDEFIKDFEGTFVKYWQERLLRK